ncbi:C40 family peptidase [Tenacibaculum sp. UWU-22]|uniref:C40 family peptidase n=1 Tax=Tenacibaculum sp. UWU-22 TaxID=3234187 RepID=UPI0034DB2A95
MLRKINFIFLVIPFLIGACSSSKKVTSSIKTASPTIADKIVWTAVSYKRTPYKYGGTTKKGMDCSGLLYVAFNYRGVSLERTTHEMFKQGYTISLGQVRRGDLLFFKTVEKSNAKINHVGLVTSVNNGIHFIHSTTSNGVIVSSLLEKYWKSSFVTAKRVL